jgi:plasmid maintenance system antidote protein VapI
MRKLHDEQANLIAQNEALGLPATTATVVDGACVPTAAADLQEIRGLAVATACEALERHIQWMSNYYWRVLIIDLSERLDQVLATAATTAVPVFHVPAWIKDLQASLLGACTEAQRLNRQIWPNLVHTVLHDLPPTHEKQRQRHQQQAAAQQQQQASTPSRSFRGSLSKKHSSGGRGGASPQETSPAAGEVAEVELGVRVGNWGLGIRVGKKEIGSPVPEGPTLGPMGGGLSNLANSFKLTRFPAAINAIVEQARRLTDECATELATELERCIEQHIRSTRSPSLQVNYQQYLTEAAGGESTERRRLKTATAATEATTAAGLPENPVENPLAMREDLSTCQLQGSGGGDTTWKPVRVTLKLDCEHIKNDILHLFVRQGSLLIGGGPLIHGGDSPGLVSMLTDVIPQFITETTQETVYVQRAHLNGRLQQVYRAIQSLTTTFGTPTDRPTALPSAASTRGGQQQQQGGGAVPAVVGGGAVRGVPTRLEDLQTGDSVDYKTKQRIWKRVRVLSVIAVDASRIMVTIERSDGRPKSFDIVKTAEVAASIAQDSPLPVSTFKSDKLRLPRKD